MRQTTDATVLPVLLSPDDPGYRAEHVVDRYLGPLLVGYAPGPPFDGRRLLTWADVSRHRLSRRALRRQAATYLDAMLGRVRIHGQPPALMLSFAGFESSVVLAEAFWARLARRVPGDLVIGVPARDVVIVTGSGSPAGLARAQRAVDRVFFAGGPHLLLRDLLVWRDGRWAPTAAYPSADRRASTAPAPRTPWPAPVRPTA